MRVMTVIGLVFNVCCRDRDTTFPLLGSFVDGAIVKEVRQAFLGLSLCDGSCQCGLGSR